jgi:hypothetical protein
LIADHNRSSLAILYLWLVGDGGGDLDIPELSVQWMRGAERRDLVVGEEGEYNGPGHGTPGPEAELSSQSSQTASVVENQIKPHAVTSGEGMSVCSFEKLVEYLDKKLDVDQKLDVLLHLDQCDACREAIYLLSRDRDEALFRYCPIREERYVA